MKREEWPFFLCNKAYLKIDYRYEWSVDGVTGKSYGSNISELGAVIEKSENIHHNICI